MSKLLQNVILAISALSCIAGMSSCDTTPPQNPNPPLARSYFYSGPEGYRFVYQSRLTRYSALDSVLEQDIDTVTYRKMGLDTNRSIGRMVYEVSESRSGLDYIETRYFTFDNDNYIEWIKNAPNASPKYTQMYRLKNPVVRGAEYQWIEGHPQRAVITSTDRAYRTLAGVYSGVEVAIRYDTVGMTEQYVPIEYRTIYTLGNGHIYLTTKSVRKHPNPDSVQTIIYDEQLMGIFRN
ncbi:MAG: hypothetical protein JNL32_01895 [Candidatus Kapabacteria bacterium]|nr:hypothetical protein [Candidatus Kapabacteria bacterium]